jgi:leucyl-tRNA synthetase
MPGWAGSSWYFLRYMDPKNENAFASNEAVNYWRNVDLYMGGSEHATGHLLYVRFWTKFLYDRGFIPVNEPAQKLINQGMIVGVSNYVFVNRQNKLAVSDEMIKAMQVVKKGGFNEAGKQQQQDYTELIRQVDGLAIHDLKFELIRSDTSYNTIKGASSVLNIEKFKEFHKGEFDDYKFISKTDFICCDEIEKMSKSKYNVVTPDAIVADYGADTLRLYEMFLGPLEQSKPWSTQGIEGVHRFLKKLWRLFYDADGNLIVTEDAADKKELKSLHKLIKKVGEDVEAFSFNTSVPAFMICVNELNDLKCNKHEILEHILVCLHPYAPHITEELWHALGNNNSIADAQFPEFNAEYLVEDSFSYPVSINGKHRTNIEFSLNATQAEIEPVVWADELVQKWLEGKTPKKIIFVKGKIINMVV